MEENRSEKPANKPVAPPRLGDSIATEISHARKVLGWTQSELHQRTGISRDTIKQYETGRHLPGAREIRLLSAALGISPNKLLLGNDDFSHTPSLLQGLMLEANGNELKMAVRFMTLNMLLTESERNAVLTLIESMLAGRNGVDGDVRSKIAFIDEVLDVMKPMIDKTMDAIAKQSGVVVGVSPSETE